MPAPHALFEVSWEVCNKVGGIHTVVSTKAKTLVSRYGDAYVVIGPWLLAGGREQFEEEHGFAEFSESCRALGVPVRVGRWNIPGRPRTILVEFSGLFAKKDAVLAGLWEHHQVDSLFGGWDYVEPVLFGHAAGIVIQKWYQERFAPRRLRAVAQFHEWLTGAGLLHLKTEAPEIGTVFTTHATILGRSVAAGGKTPEAGLEGRSPEEAAEANGVRAKHSMESVSSRRADVFTTVSGITAREAELFHHRRADPLLPNGIDLDVIDELAGSAQRAKAEAELRTLARRMCGEDLSRALLLCVSGRYEFHNKGLDVLLDALALVAKKPGKPIVLFALVPAGHSGIRSEVLERQRAPLDSIRTPDGLCTHNLFEAERDPIAKRCAERGLSNALGSRVKIVHIPLYCAPDDGLFGLPYEAILRGMQLTCFPSFYEPWGYTPEESLAVGVPTITTDCSGFGQWALEARLSPEKGVTVLRREGVDDAKTAELLAGILERAVSEERDREDLVRICRETAALTAWSGLVVHYYEAFEAALVIAAGRSSPGLAGPPAPPRPRVALPVVPGPESRRPRLTPFRVSATLPDVLRGLERLSANLWWSWDAEATALFRDLYPARWEGCRHNAVAFLRDIYTDDLGARAADAKYVARLTAVLRRFDDYLGREDAASGSAISKQHPVAYFCAEFGVHESLRIYSGGLGALAGDHLKSASDQGIPLVAVGLFYRSGYVEQRLTARGEQIAGEAINDPRELPLELVVGLDGEPVEIEIGLPSSTLYLRAWKTQVGRVPLYLLDSDVERNRPEDRGVTRQLYGGDQETRLRQEIALGRGGARLLSRLGIEPSVWHLNEGHAAFVGVERAGRMVRELGLTFDEAREIVRSSTLFTTHTPVPAGHDRFGEDLMRRYFSDSPAAFGVPWERFYELGLAEDDRASFNMTYLAIGFSSFVNGVSKLHGQVSRRLLRPCWPKLLEGEVPVQSVTNGIHLATWTDPEVARAASGSFDVRALWEARRGTKRRLLDRIRASLERSFAERGDSPALLARMLEGLDPDALWIGFARRFAPYKRAQLLFRDPVRLAKLLSNPQRPMRVVLGGKAHPHDQHGLDILKQVALQARSDPFVGRVFFLEEYDLDLARTLVQGADVWLNTPVRPLEASGTSGMKAAANGALNLSVLDGWWIEACDGRNGWAIGEPRARATQELQDELDGEHLYRLLEEEVAPLFHRRDASGLPADWLERVRHDFETIPPVFNTDRMVAEYRDRAYAPLGARWTELSRNGATGARELAARNARIRRGFAQVKIRAAHVADLTGLRVGDLVDVRVETELGPLSSEDVQVELVVGHQNGSEDLRNRSVVVLDPSGTAQGNVQSFEGSYRLDRSGGFACGIRVRARPSSEHDLGLADLALWA